MRFLVIQENGRHAKNKLFRECFSSKMALNKLGHDCDIWGLGHENYKQIDFNQYDVIIDLENYNSGWVPSLSDVMSFKVLWVIDAHCKGMNSYNRRFIDGKFDLMLQASKCLVDNSIWFPNCFDDTIVYPMKTKKEFDIGFCGNILNRQPYLDILSKEFGLKKDIFVIGEDMVKAINSYKLSFNRNIGVDINYRNFETIGCKTVLVTNSNEQYQELGFVDGQNCIIYNDINDIIEKISSIIHDDKMINEIAENGYELSKIHTYTKRMSYLIEILSDRGIK